MDTLPKIVGFSVLIGVSSALFCAQCTYKAGSDMMPDVLGVTWLTQGSPSYDPACKSGEGEMNVIQCTNKEHAACYTRVYSYNTTTYFERGCTSYCHTLPEITITHGLQMTQLCCDEGNRCNHPDNDASLMKAARREEQEGYYHQSETGAGNEIPLV